MDKTNIGLAEYCESLVANDARYWYGTYGQIANAKLLEAKAAQYPKMMSAKRVETAKKRGDYGHIVTDCIGIPKGYLMQSKKGFPPEKYMPEYDLSADGYFKKATEKGSIDTMPEIIGLGLYKKGHAGVYMGNGRVIEAKGFDYGVVEDSIKDTAWTDWYKIPWISYNDVPVADPVDHQDDHAAEPVPVPDVPSSDPVVYTVKAGDTLTAIAKKYGTTVAELVKINGIINPDLIIIGQKITLPVAGAVADPVGPLVRVGIVNTIKSPLNVRIEPNGRVIAQLAKGSSVAVEGIPVNGWYKLHDRAGYVASSYISF